MGLNIPFKNNTIIMCEELTCETLSRIVLIQAVVHSTKKQSAYMIGKCLILNNSAGIIQGTKYVRGEKDENENLGIGVGGSDGDIHFGYRCWR
jgi:hypothetical protein